MIPKFTNKRIRVGFSILEVVGALGIITIGLLGVTSLVIQNLQVQSVNRNYLVASMLAQEGLELIRNIRDNNWLSGNDWDYGIEPGSYIVDYTGYIGSVSGIGEARLKQRSDVGEEGYYWHGAGGLNSIFSRLITITQTSSELLNVSCLIQWEDREQTYQYQADTILYDWR